MSYAEIVLWALGLWGWAGMSITVEEKDLGWGILARATPAYEPWFSSCYIEVNTYPHETEVSITTIILHEVGHCVGYWPVYAGQSEHNSDQGWSVMYKYLFNDDQHITREDRMRVKEIRDGKLPHRVRVPLLAR